MRNKFLSVFLLISVLKISFNSFAQKNSGEKNKVISAINKIAFMKGNWSGDGWMQFGIQKNPVRQRVAVTSLLNGTMMKIERYSNSSFLSDTLTEQSFSIISFDITKEKYLFHTYLLNGSMFEGAVALIDSVTFQWGYPDPVSGEYKYTVNVSGDQWNETGEFSKDKNKWIVFFEMNLTHNK